MKAIALAAALAATFAASACEEETGTLPPAPQPTATVAPLSDEDLPVPADFEEEAATDIDAKNYKAMVDALEKDIAGN